MNERHIPPTFAEYFKSYFNICVINNYSYSFMQIEIDFRPGFVPFACIMFCSSLCFSLTVGVYFMTDLNACRELWNILSFVGAFFTPFFPSLTTKSSLPVLDQALMNIYLVWSLLLWDCLSEELNHKRTINSTLENVRNIFAFDFTCNLLQIA